MLARAIVSCVVFFTCAVVATPADAAEMALVPVSASGPHTIVGNQIILHGADQIVTLEIRASDWQPWLIRSFEAAIDASGAASGDAGMLVPFGWDNVDTGSVCTDDLDCPEGWVCWRQEEGLAAGFCAGPNHHPEDGVFIDEAHPDYIFHGLGTLYGVDLSVWRPEYGGGFRYGASLLMSDGSVTYTPPPRYCGTLTLVAPPTVAGTFTMAFRGEPRTFLVDAITSYPYYNIIYPDLTPALITVNPAVCGNGICDSGEDASVCPEDCLPPPIPAASTWGLAVLGLLIVTLAKVYYARTRDPARAA